MEKQLQQLGHRLFMAICLTASVWAACASTQVTANDQVRDRQVLAAVQVAARNQV